MSILRPVLLATVVLVLASHGVGAVEGDIVFQRKERPAGQAQPAEEKAGAKAGEKAGAESAGPERKPGMDVLPKAETAFYPPATFPHWVHVIRYRCFACHPRLYPMKAGSGPSVGRQNHKEKSCGRCHNGKNAFDVSFQACGRCHLPQAK